MCCLGSQEPFVVARGADVSLEHEVEGLGFAELIAGVGRLDAKILDNLVNLGWLIILDFVVDLHQLVLLVLWHLALLFGDVPVDELLNQLVGAVTPIHFRVLHHEVGEFINVTLTNKSLNLQKS